MTIECPKCGSKAWEATGRRWTSRRGLLRAGLKCQVCAEIYSSGLKAALEAAAARGESVTVTASVVPVPAPSLPLPVTRNPDYVTPGQLARSVHWNDVKARQLPREPGEDG